MESNDSFQKVVLCLKNYFCERFKEVSTEQKNASNFLLQSGAANQIRSELIQYLLQYLASSMKQFFEPINGNDLWNGMQTVLFEISTSFALDRGLLEALNLFELLGEDLRLGYATLILQQAPPDFRHNLGLFFKSSLVGHHKAWEVKRVAEQSQQTEDSDEEDEEDPIELFEEIQIEGVDQYEADILNCIKKLDWGMYLRDEIADALYGAVGSFIHQTCQEAYDEDPLAEVMLWQQEVLDPWLELVLPDSSGRAKHLEEWQYRLRFCIHEIFCTVRIDELFNIIREYTDKKEEVTKTIQVLADSLKVTHQQPQLIKSLKRQFIQRLLLPGAETHEIIQVYISSIRVLRLLDPSDSLLDEITAPIRNYLKSRKDTIRCIVNGLTDERKGFLADELRNAIPLDDAKYDSDEDESDPNWFPARREVLGSAQPRRQLSVRPGADILSILISIYGSKELFVEEYRLILAGKLLGNLDYNTDEEVKTLELLKLKFGDNSMQQCEIMIKDLQHSKNINKMIKEKLKQVGREEDVANMDAVIVSQHFWPPLQSGDGEMVLHEMIRTQVAAFSETFSVLKAQKAIEYKEQLGSVDIELEFDGGVKRTFSSISPLHANLIMHFQDKPQWTLGEIADAVGLPPRTVYKKLVFWVDRGVIRRFSGSGNLDTDGLFELIEKQNDDADRGFKNEDEHLEEEVVSSNAQKAEQMTQIEEYVIGLLKTQGSASLIEIHNHLKVFASTDDGKKYNQSPEELARLLGYSKKIKECMDGVFQIQNKQTEK